MDFLINYFFFILFSTPCIYLILILYRGIKKIEGSIPLETHIGILGSLTFLYILIVAMSYL